MIAALVTFVLPATAFILIVAVGLDLKSSDFARIRRQPGVVAAGLLAPLLILPPLALLLIRAFEAGPELAASVLLIAACPIGGISNTYSYLARASPALSVTLTSLSCVAAGVTIPLVGKGLELALDYPLGLLAPMPLLLRQLAFVLILPLVIGMGVRRWAPDFAERHAPAFRRTAIAGVAVIFTIVAAENPEAIARGLSTTVPMAVLFVAGSIAAGWIVGALVTDDSRDQFTLAAEFGARNISIALAVAVTILGRVDFARFAVTYALVEVPLLLLAVAIFRRWHVAARVGPAALSA